MKKLVLLVAIALSLSSAEEVSARFVSVAPQHKCKVVTKIVHGKKKRVRVCKKTPAPKLPEAGTVAATIPVDAGVNDLAVGDNAVWVLTDGRRLLRLDPATNGVVATIALPESEWPEDAVAVGHGSVWVTVASPDTIDHPELDSVLRIDPQTNKIVARIHVGHSPEGIGIASSGVWTANHRADWAAGGLPSGKYYVSHVDVSTNSEVDRVLVEERTTAGTQHDHWCCGPSGIITASGSIWLTDPQSYGNGLVIRVDPATNAVTARISFEKSRAVGCGRLAGDDAAIWLESSCDNTFVARIDPQTNGIVATIDTGNPTHGIALGFGAVWVTAGEAVKPGLYRIDPSTNKIVAKTTVTSPTAVATGAGSVWVGSNRDLLRITPSAFLSLLRRCGASAPINGRDHVAILDNEGASRSRPAKTLAQTSGPLIAR